MFNTLIIDDEEPVKIAVTKLADWKSNDMNEPLFASNGLEGLKIMREVHIDLVFLDMNMPIMNGPDFLDEASDEFPDTKYIIISGYDDFKYAKSALKYGASEYILKPINAEELNNAIAHARNLLKADAERMNLRVYDQPSPDDASTEGDHIPPEKVIYIIRSYIDENYMNNIHLSDFADKYYYSREYLTKRFKSEFGIGIYEYLQDVRMQHARELLQNPGMQIQNISDMLGFSDTNYFSKAFKKYYGMTPSEYRRSANG